MRLQIFCFLFVAFGYSCSTKSVITKKGIPGKAEEVIEWTESRRLQWNDYKGVPPDTSLQIAAVTNCGFGFSSRMRLIFNKPTISVSNTFNPGMSWVRDNQTDRPGLLEHEQLHFDISEIYARKLRIELAKAKLTYFNLKRKSEAIFQLVNREYLATQQLFEQQTDYSRNLIEQKKWRVKVDSELKSFGNYAN